MCDVVHYLDGRCGGQTDLGWDLQSVTSYRGSQSWLYLRIPC